MTRINAKLRVKLPGDAGYLTPYRREHVEKYSSWMTESEELRQQTGSELQTLEEEAQNQVEWREDASKCTFILTDSNFKPLGDVNLFFSNMEEEEGEGENDDKGKMKAEINVMVAEKSARNKGLGQLAVLGMAWFALRHYAQLARFEAKISLDNTPSLNLFTNRLGFREVSRSQAFQEATLVCTREEMENRLATLSPSSGFVEQICLDEVTESLRLRGNMAFEARDFYQAIKFYDEAIKLDRGDEILRGNRSAARLRSGEVFGALSDALVAVKLAPGYIKAHHRLGNAWAAMGCEEEAKQTYRIATREFPEQQEMFDTLASKTAREYRSKLASPMTRVMEEEFKLARRGKAGEVEVEIETSTNPRAMRLGSILYLWTKLAGEERMGVYEECVRAGYAPQDEAITPELLQQLPVPDWPTACKPQALSPLFARYVAALEPGLERVAALVLLFEGCSLEEREEVGKMLLAALTSSPAST